MDTQWVTDAYHQGHDKDNNIQTQPMDTATCSQGHDMDAIYRHNHLLSGSRHGRNVQTQPHNKDSNTCAQPVGTDTYSQGHDMDVKVRIP